MKKISVALLAVLMLLGFAKTQACTNFLITSGASTDGSNMITYAADSHALYGELYFRPAMDYPAGTKLQIHEWDTGKHLGEIDQVPHTYSVIGNMNEHQLVIGETTYGGLKELGSQKGAIMDYGSLIYVTLQRAKTAKEAIKVMADLVAKYGYYSSGESFSIADPNEVWIMEMIGKGEGEKGAVWVARKVPDGMVSAHANHARIQKFPLNDSENCIYSKDVISFAKKKKLYKGKDKNFSFSDTYAPIDFGGARFCEARVWAMFRRVNSKMEKYVDYARGENLTNRMPLWIKPDNKVSVHDLMELMRDHYEGTDLDMTKDMGAGAFQNPYRWRPLVWKYKGKSYFNERATSTQQTAFSFVAQCRKNLPNHIGGIFWFGMDDSYSTVYTPMYCGITEVPETFAEGNGSLMEFTMESAFWVFNMVANFAYTRYSIIMPEIQKVQNELETKYIAQTSGIDKAAVELYKTNPELGRKFITEYSVNQGNNTTKRWTELYAHLFTRFMDGNVKEVAPNQRDPKVEYPGYGEKWYKKIIEETGDKFKMKGDDGH